MNAIVERRHMIFWGMTTGCDLRCLWCRATAQELASALDLPTAKALSLIEQVSSYAHQSLVLSGGNPLLIVPWAAGIEALPAEPVGCS